MDGEVRAVAEVIGIFREKGGGFEPLTPETPLTLDQVRRQPIFYILDLDPERGGDDLIIDIVYDNLPPVRLADLRRGTDIPRGVRFWPDWFEIPPYAMMQGADGRAVYPRGPGIHTIRIRTACRKRAQIGRARDFSPQNGGSESPLFRIRILPGDEL